MKKKKIKGKIFNKKNFEQIKGKKNSIKIFI
jgi:hypothetical protein